MDNYIAEVMTKNQLALATTISRRQHSKYHFWAVRDSFCLADCINDLCPGVVECTSLQVGTSTCSSGQGDKAGDNTKLHQESSSRLPGLINVQIYFQGWAISFPRWTWVRRRALWWWKRRREWRQWRCNQGEPSAFEPNIHIVLSLCGTSLTWYRLGHVKFQRPTFV